MKHTVCPKHNSDHYNELLTVFASGNSSPQDRQRVEKLLAQCSDCRHKVMELEQTWWALDIWEHDERQVPLRIANFRSRLSEVKNQQPAWKRRFEHVSFFFRPAQLMPAMSMAAVIIVAAVMMYHPDNTLINPQENAVFTQANVQANPKSDNTSTANPSAVKLAVAAEQSSVQDKTGLDSNLAGTVAVSHQSAETNSSREDRFNIALRNSASPQASRYTANRSQYVQTAGFTPSKSIFSPHDMMDEKILLQPGYVPPVRQ